MIGKLKGKVDTIGESFCIVDVGGVGYEVQASARTLRNMKIGDDVALTIDTHVREDAIRLYGFASEVERSWFRTLQSVQGVGSKVALGLLGTLEPAGSRQCHRARQTGRASSRRQASARSWRSASSRN